jgi:hypothetical protein
VPGEELSGEGFEVSRIFDYMRGVAWCKLEDVGKNDYNPRDLNRKNELNALKQLRKSIEESGLMDPPVLAKVFGDNKLVPVSGNRRLHVIREMCDEFGFEEIPYIPLSWRGYEEPVTPEVVVNLTVWVQKVTKSHTSRDVVQIAQNAYNDGVPTTSLPKSAQKSAALMEFLNRHKNLNEMVMTRERNKKGVFPRVQVPWTVVDEALKRTSSEDEAMRHISRYVKGAYLTRDDMRRMIEKERAS